MCYHGILKMMATWATINDEFSSENNSHRSQNGAFYWVLVGKYEQVRFYSRSQSLLPRGKRRPRVFEQLWG